MTARKPDPSDKWPCLTCSHPKVQHLMRRRREPWPVGITGRYEDCAANGCTCRLWVADEHAIAGMSYLAGGAS